jgi:hypothetical protein
MVALVDTHDHLLEHGNEAEFILDGKGVALDNRDDATCLR